MSAKIIATKMNCSSFYKRIWNPNVLFYRKVVGKQEGNMNLYHTSTRII